MAKTIRRPTVALAAAMLLAVPAARAEAPAGYTPPPGTVTVNVDGRNQYTRSFRNCDAVAAVTVVGASAEVVKIKGGYVVYLGFDGSPDSQVDVNVSTWPPWRCE
jgi:hypothetical protein